MSETKLDPHDRLAVMVSMAGSYIESGRGDDALAVMRTVAEDVATEIARLTRELEEARRERSAARAEAMTAQASLRRAKRELEAARERERRIIEVLERSACHDLTARDALDAVRRALTTEVAHAD